MILSVDDRLKPVKDYFILVPLFFHQNLGLVYGNSHLLDFGAQLMLDRLDIVLNRLFNRLDIMFDRLFNRLDIMFDRPDIMFDRLFDRLDIVSDAADFGPEFFVPP